MVVFVVAGFEERVGDEGGDFLGLGDSVGREGLVEGGHGDGGGGALLGELFAAGAGGGRWGDARELLFGEAAAGGVGMCMVGGGVVWCGVV